MEPKASSEHLYSLPARLGYRYPMVFPSFSLAGGYVLYVKQGISFDVIETNDNLVAA